MTSSLPNRLYGDGFRRLGYDEGTTDYFDEHVEADAVHEQIAGRDLAGGWRSRSPTWPATSSSAPPPACYLDDLVGRHLLDAWSAGDVRRCVRP